MRHHPSLTPTARLIIKAISESSIPLSRIQLAEATSASPYTIDEVTQSLVKRGLLHRDRISSMSFFSLPANPDVEVLK